MPSRKPNLGVECPYGRRHSRRLLRRTNPMRGVRPTVRIGVPLVDAMRSGGKESELCGTCLMAMKVRLEKTCGQEAEGLPD